MRLLLGFLIGFAAAWWMAWHFRPRRRVAMAGDLGWLVYDQTVFPIVAMWLADGKVHCLGRTLGPLEPVARGAHGMTIYAPDGTVVVSALVIGGWEAIPAGVTVDFDQSFTNEWNGVTEGR